MIYGLEDFPGDEYASDEYAPEEKLDPEDGDMKVDGDRENFEESKLRESIRDILGLSWDTRDEAILDELRRLRAVDAARTALAQS